MVAGYSKRKLTEKLGIKPGFRICILNSPPGYDANLGNLPAGTERMQRLAASLDFIHFFTRQQSELERKFPTFKKSLAKDGMLWISWPKGSSKIKTDLNENVVRKVGLENQMVDIKVCAVDEIWSGLKFVYRLKDRGERT
jgi:hypothetical protein